MECVPSLDKVHEALLFVGLQWEKAGFVEDRHARDEEEDSVDVVAARERFGVVSFQCIVETVHVVRGTDCVKFVYVRSALEYSPDLN